MTHISFYGFYLKHDSRFFRSDAEKSSGTAAVAYQIGKHQLHAPVSAVPRHSPKRILTFLVPGTAAFHSLKHHPILDIVRLQLYCPSDIAHGIHIVSQSQICHGRKIIPLTISLLQRRNKTGKEYDLIAEKENCTVFCCFIWRTHPKAHYFDGRRKHDSGVRSV